MTQLARQPMNPANDRVDLRKKKKSTGGKLNQSNAQQSADNSVSARLPGGRADFVALRRQQNDRAGINSDQLERDNDSLRVQINNSSKSRIDGGRRVRRLRSQGRDDEADALVAQLREQRADEFDLRQEVARRSALLRPSLADLPPDEYIAERQRGQAHLNAQLPAVAGAAASAATQAEGEYQEKLAQIGARVFEIQSGYRSADGLSPSELANLALGADPDVIDRATNGVGLPRSDSVDLRRRNASRLASLSEDGIDFGPITPRSRRVDPALVDQIVTEQGLGEQRRVLGNELAEIDLRARRQSGENRLGALEVTASEQASAISANERTTAENTSAVNLQDSLEARERSRLRFEQREFEGAGTGSTVSAPVQAAVQNLSDPGAAQSLVVGQPRAAIRSLMSAGNPAEAVQHANTFAAIVSSVYTDQTTSPADKRAIAQEIMAQLNEGGINLEDVRSPGGTSSTIRRLLKPILYPTSRRTDADRATEKNINDTLDTAIRRLSELLG